MWTHQNSELRMAEGETGGGGGGQPAPVTQVVPAVQPGPDLIPRAEAKEAFAARDNAKLEARTFAAELEQTKAKAERLEAELAALRNPPPAVKPSEPQSKPDPVEDMRAQLAALLQRERQRESAERQRTLVDSVKRGVPERHHQTVDLVIRGMYPTGLPEGPVDTLATTVLESLKTNHSSLFAPEPGSARSVTPTGPNGAILWSGITHLNQIPRGVPIPTDQYARLRGAGVDAPALLIAAQPGKPASQ